MAPWLRRLGSFDSLDFPDLTRPRLPQHLVWHGPYSDEDAPDVGYRVRVGGIFALVGLGIVVVVGAVAALAWMQGESPRTLGAIVFVGLAGVGLAVVGGAIVAVSAAAHGFSRARRRRRRGGERREARDG